MAIAFIAPRFVLPRVLFRHSRLVACLLMLAAAASAFAQDKMVLGIELGTRLLAPACSAAEGTFTSRLCVTSTVTPRAWGADEYHVMLPGAGTPPYVRGGLKVLVVKGMVEAVQIETWGIEAQGGAFTALTKKYGEPTRTSEQKLKGLRSRFPTRFAQWEFKDFSVKFDGTTGSIDWGRIEVATHRYRKLVQDYEKQSPANASR